MTPMKHLFLAVALAAISAAATAQTAPNPFARPAARPQPTAPAQTGTPAPGAQSGTATSAPAPQPFPTATPQPANGFNGGMPVANMPGPAPTVASPDAPIENVEEIQASRIGKVNGYYVYRGTNTYLFEETRGKKIVRKPVVVSPTMGGMLPPPIPGQANQPPANNTSNLPSMVGRPAPRN